MRFPCVLIAVALVASGRPAAGFELVGTTGGTSLSLCEIDKATGALESSFCDSIGLISPYDLASNPRIDPLVWAVTRDFFGDGKIELVGIDTQRKELASRTSIMIDEPLLTLAVDPTGHFYATTATQLVRLDPISGDVTVIGDTMSSVENGLAFDSSGALYGIGGGRRLMRIDVESGAATLVGDVTDVFRIEDLAFDPDNDELYGIGYDGVYRLYTIDVATAEPQVVGPSLGRPSGLAFAAIPEPGTVVLGLAWALAGCCGRHGRTSRMLCG
ncbi:MAG: hypothetical protein KDA61_05205 [Planctomycetales bacterium]|nr:hypothetical protein [Planctomycetales bacterium]